MNYKGIIIEESLENKDVLKKVKILGTRVEKITQRHQTPWLTEWTWNDVEVEEGKAQEIAEEISTSMDSAHPGSWFADFKNDTTHYIIFPNKVFYVDRSKEEQYAEARNYGISIGIADYQLAFHPDGEIWDR